MPFRALRERILGMSEATFRSLLVVLSLIGGGIIGFFLYEWHLAGAPIPVELRNFATAAAPILTGIALFYLRHIAQSIDMQLKQSRHERQALKDHIDTITDQQTKDVIDGAAGETLYRLGNGDPQAQLAREKIAEHIAEAVPVPVAEAVVQQLQQQQPQARRYDTQPLTFDGNQREEHGS